MDNLLRRKVDAYLIDWNNNPEKKPLIVKSARQIGKTRPIEHSANENYKNVIQINGELSSYRDGFRMFYD